MRGKKQMTPLATALAWHTPGRTRHSSRSDGRLARRVVSMVVTIMALLILGGLFHEFVK